MLPASTTANPTVPTQLPVASSTNTRGSGEGAGLVRGGQDRQTIHSTFPSRHHNPSGMTGGGDSRASTRNANNNTMGSNDGSARYHQQTDGASSMIGGTGTGAQSFLSKLSSKFARR